MPPQTAKALLGFGVVVNVALLLYILVNDVRALGGGEIRALESTSVVCNLMVAIGLVLYVVNSLAQGKDGCVCWLHVSSGFVSCLDNGT
jgi:ligand-binding sensor domain-containing protein